MTIRQWRVSRDTLIRDANDVYYLSLASQFAVGYRKVNDAMLLQYEWMWAVTFYHVIVSHQTFPVSEFGKGVLTQNFRFMLSTLPQQF